jgi:cobalt-zinc-cadmium resistance protein CzcA
MLNKIIEFSIKNKLVTGLLVAGLVGYGCYEVTKLSIDAVPDITDNQVQVITVTPSLGAPDVERLITFPIEQAASNIPGLKTIRSFSRFGLSLITIVFNDGVDVYWARQQVAERLKIAENQIPKGVGIPEMGPVTTGLGEIYQYVIRPKHGYESRYDLTELRTIQDWIVRRQLLGVKGVADVSSFGGKVKQYEIAVMPGMLKSHNITINDVFASLEKNNENTGGAYIEKTSTVLFIRTEGLIGSIEDIRNIVVKNTKNGTPLLLNDVAEIKIGNATRYGAMTYNDEGEVAGAVVMMLKGDNSSRVIVEVKKRIMQIQKTLPEGVELVPFLDRTKMVNSAINTVATNLVEGAVIVILILVLFLGNLRAGLIVASVIPLSMLFAIIMMNTFGVSGNLMSLGALDFGLIVDGAVIIVEACMAGLHTIRQQRVEQITMDDLVYTTARRMRNAAVFGGLIILVVYLPVFSLEGIEGKMFKPMAQTVAFALLGAFMLSLTYVPMITSLLLGKNTSHKKNISDRIMETIDKVHRRTLTKVLQMPKTIVAAVLVLFAGSLFVFSTMGGEFIPSLPEGDFAVETRLLTGSNLLTTSQVTMKTARVLLNKFPEVEKVVGKIGSGEIPTDPMPMEASDIMVILKDRSQWTSASNWNELAEKMAEELKGIPGITYSFQYPVAMRFNELMTGAKQDVVCRIFGENLDTLSKYSKFIGRAAESVNGVKDTYIEQVNGLPQLVIAYNRNLVAEYGLNIQDMNKAVNMAFAGQSSGLVYEDEKRFDLVVRLAGSNRKKIEDVQDLLVETPEGTQIPLRQVADISVKESVIQIQRDNARRRISVGFNVRGRDVQSVVADLQAKVERIRLPSGYYVSYGGAFENLVAAKKRLLIAVPVSLLLIFFLLYFTFHSVRQGLLIYSAIPLSAIGGIFFMALRGMPFSISAGVGFIALFGVAVLNGIVLITEYNRLRDEGETDLVKIVLEGTRHRLRPVLMTAFVASLGFLPMALSNGNGAEVQRPLATVVIGGLLVATFLTLFVLPALFIVFEKKGFIGSNTIGSLSVVLFLFYSGGSNAQQTISLDAAIDTALKNSFTVKNEKLSAEYQKKLRAVAVDLPQTSVIGEYGQINSVYNDTKFSISQAVNFPTVYARRKSRQTELYRGALINLALKEIELKKEVSAVFCELLYLEEKKDILERNDSIYNIFLKETGMRFSSGESNVLEKMNAEAQRGQVALQLQSVNTDIEIEQLHFRFLLNTGNNYQPSKEVRIVAVFTVQDSSVTENHPQLKLLSQQRQLSVVNTQIERSKLLPELTFGYSNQSIRGIGADNNFYTPSSRFNAVHVGVGIPIFSGAQRARLSSSKTLQLISDNNYQLGVSSFRIEYETALRQYRNQLKAVEYFERNALKNAATLLEAANLQLKNGSINFLEWTVLVNSAIMTQSNYADAVRNLNQSIIQLNYLTTK